MNERTRKRLDSLDPERRTRAEAAIARSTAPERRAEEARIREQFAGRPGPDDLYARGEIDEEFRDGMKADMRSRAAVSPVVAAAVQEMRAERERQGLSLADVARATGSDRGAIHKLETGANANPTFATLDRLAGALGKRLVITLEDAAPTVVLIPGTRLTASTFKQIDGAYLMASLGGCPEPVVMVVNLNDPAGLAVARSVRTAAGDREAAVDAFLEEHRISGLKSPLAFLSVDRAEADRVGYFRGISEGEMVAQRLSQPAPAGKFYLVVLADGLAHVTLLPIPEGG